MNDPADPVADIDSLMAELDRINAEQPYQAEPEDDPQEEAQGGPPDDPGPEPEPIETGPPGDDRSRAEGVALAAGLIVIAVGLLLLLNHYLLFFPGAPGYP